MEKESSTNKITVHKPEWSQSVIIADKVAHKFQLHKLMEGGGIVAMGEWGIRLVPSGKDFTRIQILAIGQGKFIENTSYSRPKPKPKESSEEIKVTISEEQKELFK